MKFKEHLQQWTEAWHKPIEPDERVVHVPYESSVARDQKGLAAAARRVDARNRVKKHGFKSEEDVIEYLELQHHRVSMTNGIMTVHTDLNLIDLDLRELPVKLGKVEGNLKLQGNYLSTFEWAHKLDVDGEVNLMKNNIESCHPSISRGSDVL